jgi:hypothetical protein
MSQRGRGGRGLQIAQTPSAALITIPLNMAANDQEGTAYTTVNWVTNTMMIPEKAKVNLVLRFIP